MNKFLINRRVIERELEEPLKVTESEVKKNVKEAYIESLTPVERKRTKRVFKDISAYTPLRWDEKGRLIHEGSTIEGSKLDDIVSYELKTNTKRSRTKPPIGWDTYSTYRGRQTVTPTTHITSRPQRRIKTSLLAIILKYGSIF